VSQCTIPNPAESLVAMVRWLNKALGDRHVWAPIPMLAPIMNRLRQLAWRIERIVARIHDGVYVPRCRPAIRPATPRDKAVVRPPRKPDPLPLKWGWMLELARPMTVLPRNWLDELLENPEMARLVATAPPLRRPIRTLCRWLGSPMPAFLALPRRPARPRPAAPKPAAAKPQKPKQQRLRPVSPRFRAAFAPTPTPAHARAPPKKPA
jgi:hypothetical protein